MGSVVSRWMDALLVIPVTYYCHTLQALGGFTCIYHLPYLGGRLYDTIIQDTRIPTVPVAYIGFPLEKQLRLAVIEVSVAMEGRSNQSAVVKATSLEVLQRMYAPSWKARGWHTQ